MSRRRIHELAKEWGVDTPVLIAKLEKLGVRNKRSQSSLTDDEVERAKAEFTVEEKPTIVVGGERTVQGAEGQTLVERRVTTQVIRRRATARTEPAGGLSTPPP